MRTIACREFAFSLADVVASTEKMSDESPCPEPHESPLENSAMLRRDLTRQRLRMTFRVCNDMNEFGDHQRSKRKFITICLQRLHSISRSGVISMAGHFVGYQKTGIQTVNHPNISSNNSSSLENGFKEVPKSSGDKSRALFDDPATFL